MILVVVPAYNEEKNIGRVIRGLFQNGYKNILVVDDGSTDMTAEVARKEGASVVKHFLNRGQGAALETGDEYGRRAGAEIVVHFDADGQFDPGDINKALLFMEKNGYDVVLGSRFLDMRSSVPFLKRYFVLPIARLINFLFIGVLLTDAHNGFRILNKKALQLIRIEQDRMAHNTEIIQKTRASGLKFAEFPVEVKYNEYGQNALSGFKILGDLIIGFFTK